MKIFFVLLPLLVFLSCSIQDRKYQKGYTVSWHNRPAGSHGAQSSEQNKLPQPLLTLETKPALKPSLSASGASGITAADLFTAPGDSCDVITFKDGSEQRVNILEIGRGLVKYKKCDMADSPLYTTNASQVFMITYKNGTKEIIKEEVVQQPITRAYEKDPRQKSTGSSSMATSALVFSILGFYPLIFVGCIIGLILSTIHLNNISNDPERYRGAGKAKVAQIISIVGLAIGCIIIALFFISGF